jgi:Helix-turn-helix domain
MHTQSAGGIGSAANAVAKTPVLLPVNDACRELKIGPSSFYKYVRLGKIKTIKKFGRRFVPASEIGRIAVEGTE